MLSAADNEMMCRVGADTPMGKAMRRFWIPAFLSSELPVGSDTPFLFELLNEQLVAFRDDNGRVGILGEQCCHRGASLGLGRVENCGLRCIYHGWLFDVNGKVLETPNVADDRFKARVKHPAYPTVEAGGLVWTYLGQDAELPPMPDFPWLASSEENRDTSCVFVKANYVQVMEGVIDSSHLSVLHQDGLKGLAASDADEGQKSAAHMVKDTAPRMEAEATPWGMQYAAIRTVGGKQETRVAAYVSPFYVLNPASSLWFLCVPVTDERTGFYHVNWDDKGTFADPKTRQTLLAFGGLTEDQLVDFRVTRDTWDLPDAPSRSNRWRQDREAIRNGRFSGLPSLVQEDVAVVTSARPIRDRTKETLATADLAIAATYRALLANARAGAEGRDPAAIDQRIGHLRGAAIQQEIGDDWHAAVPMNAAETPQEAELVAG
jgi:phthalate 4,5-dioxygenase